MLMAYTLRIASALIQRYGMQVLRLQSANGFSQEDSSMVIEGMAAAAAEPTYCMGDDIPLPVLSGRPHMLADYFKQRFAQARPAAHGMMPYALIRVCCAWLLWPFWSFGRHRSSRLLI